MVISTAKINILENETNLTLELANPNNDRIDTIILKKKRHRARF